ncbi:MAG: CPBP family intramembrane metalloprotease [Lachnospiraceae bacterium]|nr:CPBP family intramembrane metalloprotease [Lachnospiraceae bacterium]
MKDRDVKRVNVFFLSLVLLHIAASVVVSMLSISAVKIGTFGTLMFTQLLIMVPSFIFLILFRCDLSEWVPLKKLRSGTVALVILFTFMIMPFIGLINVFSQLFTTNTAVEMSGGFMEMPVVVTVIVVGFFGPFCEEFTFRGIIFSGLRKQGYVFAAAVMSAVFFGLMHLNLNQLSYTLVLGVMFSLLVEATGSIWGSIISHAVINTWNVLLMIIFDKMDTMSNADLYSMSRELITTDMKLESMGILLVLSVLGVAAATGTFIAICRNEGRFDNVISMFYKPEQGGVEAKESASSVRLVTLSGYIAIGICLFVIFFLEKVVVWVQNNIPGK